MPARSVERDHGMCAGSDPRADLRQMQVHRRNVDVWQHKGGTDATSGANRTEQIGGDVALIVRCARAAAALGPDIGQAALLADARVRRENSPPDCFLARLTLATRARSACPVRALG